MLLIIEEVVEGLSVRTQPREHHQNMWPLTAKDNQSFSIIQFCFLKVDLMAGY